MRTTLKFIIFLQIVSNSVMDNKSQIKSLNDATDLLSDINLSFYSTSVVVKSPYYFTRKTRESFDIINHQNSFNPNPDYPFP